MSSALKQKGAKIKQFPVQLQTVLFSELDPCALPDIKVGLCYLEDSDCTTYF